jgi:hypothetical protein
MSKVNQVAEPVNSAVVAPVSTVASAPLAIAPPFTPESGRSALKAFRYTGKWTHVTLKNGVAGIVGSAEQYPFRDLLLLRGSGMEVEYTRLENRKTAKGEYKSYALDWSAE